MSGAALDRALKGLKDIAFMAPNVTHGWAVTTRAVAFRALDDIALMSSAEQVDRASSRDTDKSPPPLQSDFDRLKEEVERLTSERDEALAELDGLEDWQKLAVRAAAAGARATQAEKERDQYDADLKLMAAHANALSDLRRAAEATLSEVVGVVEPFAEAAGYQGRGDLWLMVQDHDRKCHGIRVVNGAVAAAAALLQKLKAGVSPYVGGRELASRDHDPTTCAAIAPPALTDQGGEP